MSNSARAKTRRARRCHMSKHQRGIMASQHFGDKESQKNAEIRGKGDNRIKELMGKVTDG